MTLQPGDHLGPYAIVSLVGSGGMGEVYKARDTRLDRTVAIKVLPPALSGDEHARRRLAREARVIAGLSHPHICPLFDVGEYQGADFLVMEFLDGETLAQRLKRGHLPLEQALRYGGEIAAALSAAHAAGIVHRDLKPANVILTKGGARLVDFGIGKPQPDLALVRDNPTTEPITSEGSTPGTLQYMAPEQLEGGDADSRTDIFALGALLYEMVSGRKAFEARTEAALIARILRSDPAPLAGAGADVPPALEYLIRTCLAKAPDLRWQSAQDVVLGLRRIEEERAIATPPAGPGWWRRLPQAVRMGAGILTVVAATLGAVALYRSSGEAPPPAPARFDVSLPEGLGFDWPDWRVVSPDGQRVAFSARSKGRRQLWVRFQDGAVGPVADTEGAAFAFWSPDSRSVAFFAGGKLKRVDAGGGPVTVLSDAYSVGRGAWGRGGVILFVPRPNGPVHAVVDSGGTSRAVTVINAAKGETSHRVLCVLPDGRHFLYSTTGRQPGIFAGTLDGGEVRDVLPGVTAATFAEPGFLIFNRQESLMAQRFDAAALEPRGSAVAIADGISGGAFSASSNGTLIFRAGASSGSELVWILRDGRHAGTVGAPAYNQQVELSPSGSRAAVQRIDTETGNADLWIVDVATGVASRLTLDPALDADPVWAPDEHSIAFTTFRTGRGTVYLRDLVTGREEPLIDASPPPPSSPQDTTTTSLAPARLPDGIAVDDWTSDGRTLVVRTFGRAVFSVPFAGSRVPVMLVDTPYVEDQTQVSPDGRFIAFNSDESGRWEVYVAAFPGFTDKRQVSLSGGMQPRWRRDSHELFYLAADGTMMAAEIAAHGPPMSGMPRALFQTRLSPSPNVPQYDVSGDGERFLVIEPARAGGEPLTFLLNWPSALGR
jgi:Tol biopolymer transport system component